MISKWSKSCRSICPALIQFDCRQLIGKQIDCTGNGEDEDVLGQSFRSLHDLGPSHIIISSVSAAKLGGNQTNLQLRASSKLPGRLDVKKSISIHVILDNQYQTFRIDFPRLEGIFTGTGDSFSALLLAWFHRDKSLIVSNDLPFLIVGPIP